MPRASRQRLQNQTHQQTTGVTNNQFNPAFTACDPKASPFRAGMKVALDSSLFGIHTLLVQKTYGGTRQKVSLFVSLRCCKAALGDRTKIRLRRNPRTFRSRRMSRWFLSQFPESADIRAERSSIGLSGLPTAGRILSQFSQQNLHNPCLSLAAAPFVVKVRVFPIVCEIGQGGSSVPLFALR